MNVIQDIASIWLLSIFIITFIHLIIGRHTRENKVNLTVDASYALFGPLGVLIAIKDYFSVREKVAETIHQRMVVNQQISEAKASEMQHNRRVASKLVAYLAKGDIAILPFSVSATLFFPLCGSPVGYLNGIKDFNKSLFIINSHVPIRYSEETVSILFRAISANSFELIEKDTVRLRILSSNSLFDDISFQYIDKFVAVKVKGSVQVGAIYSLELPLRSSKSEERWINNQVSCFCTWDSGTGLFDLFELAVKTGREDDGTSAKIEWTVYPYLPLRFKKSIT